MTFIALLWLPILLSAAAVFAVSAASHMLLPWHVSEFDHLPGEAAVQGAVRDLPPGEYAFPSSPDPKQRMNKEVLARWEAGPAGWITVVPRGPIAMGQKMGQSFLVYLVVSFLTAYLAQLALGDAPARLLIVRVTWVVGILAYGTGVVFNSVWYGRPWKAYLVDLGDAVAQGLAMAAVFAWLWPR